ncbi:DMP19 family protein [Pseudooceanicola sp. C21-150M6]|uniref:DMP19 family protein n=1 Tax=Pseudooceanicola sp. C21-150M6 TaxID=3434355 RepID=UPI003D7F8ECE
MADKFGGLKALDDSNEITAWNNFVMNADPDLHGACGEKRNAAIACLYMGGANNGGLNAFLTNYAELDADEVLQSLEAVGASPAADQFQDVLQKLGEPLPATTQDKRWDQLERLWTDELDEIDVLNTEADESLLAALKAHVSKHMEYYLTVSARNSG